MPRTSYAVYWDEGEGPRHAGKLELAALHALLSGSGGGRLAVPFDEITSVNYIRGELRLERRQGGPVRIGSLDAPGALLEAASRLAARIRSPAAA
jgi:hypothetical protein